MPIKTIVLFVQLAINVTVPLEEAELVV